MPMCATLTSGKQIEHAFHQTQAGAQDGGDDHGAGQGAAIVGRERGLDALDAGGQGARGLEDHQRGEFVEAGAKLAGARAHVAQLGELHLHERVIDQRDAVRGGWRTWPMLPQSRRAFVTRRATSGPHFALVRPRAPHRLLILAFSLAAQAVEPLAIEIDLAAQKAFLLQDGKIVYESPISSGRPGHRTPTGNFQVLEKDEIISLRSTGRIVDASGKTVVRDADADMAVPKGGKFVQAPMKHFLRFDGANGMHSGYLPGYPASHGCVRMPDVKAELFFSIAEVGTPVPIHGKPPETTPPRRKSRKPQPRPPPPHRRRANGGRFSRAPLPE